jgi:hypothetical protein
MDKYLLEILQDKNTIIIPGLGALTITNKKTGAIKFMPYLTHDDGALSLYISESEGMEENESKNLIFMADLLPSVGHIPVPYVMGYDTRPLITLSEKEKFLTTAQEKDYILFFEHDFVNECCTLQNTEKGIRAKETFNFSDLF